MHGLLCAGRGAAWGHGLGPPRGAAGAWGACRGAGPPEAAGFWEEAPTGGWGVQLCVCRDGGFVCLTTSLPDGSMSGSDPRWGHWVTWIQDLGGGFSLSGNSSGCETRPGAPI